MRFLDKLMLLAFLTGVLLGMQKPPPLRLSEGEVAHEIRVMLSRPAPVVKTKDDTMRLKRVSAYNAVPRQTQGDPKVSSCGPNLPRQIALSRDLFFDEAGRKHMCGRIVSILTDRGELFENYVVWDTMAPRFTETADVLWHTDDESEAYAFGITTGTLIFHNN